MTAFGQRQQLSELIANPDWFLAMAASLVFSYVFYLLVERPSHALARTIKVRNAQQIADPTNKASLASVDETALSKEVAQI